MKGAVERPGDKELSAKLQLLSRKASMYLLLAVLFGVITLISGYVAFWGGIRVLWAVFAVALVGILVFIVLRMVKKIEMNQLVSENIALSILEESFEVIEFDHFRTIDEDLLQTARMPFDWDDIDGGNYLHGKYNGVEFQFSDIMLTATTTVHDDEGDEDDTIEDDGEFFKGQWLVVKLSEDITPPVLVSGREKYTYERKNDGLVLNSEDKSAVETDNTLFDEKFIVETKEPQLASHILTPDLMEYLMSMRENGQIHLCFSRTHVHLAIGTERESFDVEENDINDIPALREKIKHEFKHNITDFVDELLTNDWLFKPE